MATRLTGGCQCGAIRYALTAEPTSVSLCHCRMCQKATGGAFLASGGVPVENLTWTRGQPGTFLSSSVAARDFCPGCGTPLTYRVLDSDRISFSLGSLDTPDAVAPENQIGIENRLAWWAGASALPGKTTAEDSPPAFLSAIVNRQHPDHDTGDDWRPPALDGQANQRTT